MSYATSRKLEVNRAYFKARELNEGKKLHQFRNLLKFVLKHNQFYREKYKRIGITSADQVKTWGDFLSLPLTTRGELLQDQYEHPLFGTNLSQPPSAYTYVINTSGTSRGQPFFHPLTTGEFERFVTVFAEGDKKLGLTKKDIFCHIAPLYAYPLIYAAVVQRIGARMVPTETFKFVDFLKRLQKMKVTTLQGYPTIIYELIEVAKEAGINLKELGIKKIFTIGEFGGGYPPTKSYFEKKWGAEVIDHIGSIETATLAIICSKTYAYHIMDNHLITEVIKINSNKQTHRGELVITPLWRHDYPLIRYRSGDVGEISYDSCPCGQRSPSLVKGIIGRVTGQIKLRSGFVYPEEIERAIRKHPEVIDYQILCTNQKGIDMLHVFAELPLNSQYNLIEKITKTLENTIGFTPLVYPLLPKTLDRFGVRKAKRFFDYRTKIPSQSDPHLRSRTIFLSKIYLRILLVNQWRSKLFSIFKISH